VLLLLQQRIPKNGSTFPHSTNCIFTTGHGDQNKIKKQVIVNFFKNKIIARVFQEQRKLT
jgi:hypothetical protein